MSTYRTGPSDAPRPVYVFAPTLATMCGRIGRAADGRVFACALPRDTPHGGSHVSYDRTGPVPLGFAPMR